jgi:hypothetical protein
LGICDPARADVAVLTTDLKTLLMTGTRWRP